MYCLIELVRSEEKYVVLVYCLIEVVTGEEYERFMPPPFPGAGRVVKVAAGEWVPLCHPLSDLAQVGDLKYSLYVIGTHQGEGMHKLHITQSGVL